MPETVRTWRTRQFEVQAIHWLGEKNCEETFAFIGWEHPDDELDHSHIVGLGLDGSQEAEPGDWIVKDEDGVYEVFTDTAFRAEFETADTEAQIRDFTWGQSIGLNKATGIVDLPFNDGVTWVGNVQVYMLDVHVLRDMLTEALEEAEVGHA